MKKTIVLVILFGIVFLTYYFQEEIVTVVTETFFSGDKINTTLTKNDYTLNKKFMFVNPVDEFKPKNRKDIQNIFYTIINSGANNFTFYCPKEYNECLDDVRYVSGNQKLLSDINNYAHSFNSFRHLETEYDNLGRVTVRIDRTYNKEEIAAINKKMDQIEKEIYNETMGVEQKIKVVHDYIIKNASYDSDRSDKKLSNYKSDTAYGTLLQGKAICGGYADSMKLFLDRLLIPNYKIASENHVWNLVKLNGEWLHLDLTWDDPVIEGGGETLEYNYYLITTLELHELEVEQHVFDSSVYIEAK